jgi:hypothetical protein
VVFDVEITDLYGSVLATVERYSGVEVALALGEDRSGKVDVSVYHPAVAELSFAGLSGHRIGALGRMLRIKYRGDTQVWGIQTQPKWSTRGSTVSVPAQGPGFRLKHRHLNYGDSIVGEEEAPLQNPSDYRTMRAIVEAVYDNADQRAINVPDIGILAGVNSGPEAPAGFWTQIERGSNTWDKLIEVARSIYGAEFDLAPYDPAAGETPFDASQGTVNVDGAYEFPNSPIGPGQTPADIPILPGGLAELPPSGELIAGVIDGTGLHRDYTLTYESRTDTEIQNVTGYPALGDFDDGDPISTRYGRRPYHYADLNTYDSMGTDRTATLTFLYDDTDPDASNLRDFDWEPDGENTRNQQVSLMSSSDAEKRGIRKIARNITSWQEIGIYSGWDSISGANVEDVSEDNVAGHAQAEVERYGRPPNYFKAYLRLEPADGTPTAGNPGHQPQFGRDFFLGDRAMFRARKGYMDSGLLEGRIIGVKLVQADQSNNVSVELDCVPHVSPTSEISVV